MTHFKHLYRQISVLFVLSITWVLFVVSMYSATP